MTDFYTRMRLNRGRIMVRLIDAPVPEGLIVEIQGIDERKPKYAEVINVGPPYVSENGHEHPMPWSVGDRLMLNGTPGTDLHVAGKQVRIIHYEGDTHGLVPRDVWPE